MPNGSHSAPVREDFADELRGFALLGTVVVNVPFLGISWHGFTRHSLATPLDVAAAFVTIAFVQAKFYVLFSFLFGYSMSFIVKNESPAGIARFRRRLTGLAVFGVLHAVLFFVGDILLLYALLGGCLLWLWQKSDAFVLRFVWITLAAWCALLALIVVTVWHDPADLRIDAAETRIIDSALRSGTLWEATAARLRAWPSAFSLILTLNGLCVLSMFALGLFAGRRRMFAAPQLHTNSGVTVQSGVVRWACQPPFVRLGWWWGRVRASTPWVAGGQWCGRRFSYGTIPHLGLRCVVRADSSTPARRARVVQAFWPNVPDRVHW